MLKQIKFLALFMATLLIVCGSIIWSVEAKPALTNQSKLYIDRLGPITIGMSHKDALKVLDAPFGLSPDFFNKTSCYYLNIEGGPQDVGFMIIDGYIARIDVWKNSPVTTASGAKIGDTEATIKLLYRGKIQVTPHKYVPGGHYLTFIPQELAYRNYRLVFETDGKRVTKFRAGKLPEVEYVESCG